MSETALSTAPPPEPPELPAGAGRAPGWPWWYGLVGFLAALVATFVAVGIAAAVVGVDPDEDWPATLVVVGTLIQSVVFIGTAVAFASFVKRPEPWHFGFRRTALWQAVGWTALAVFAFYVFAIVYGLVVQPDVEQEVVESLGADESTLGLIFAGVMVIAVAPVAEEFFFRGFFYGALRTRFGVVLAAVIDGLLFGAIHYQGWDGGEGLLLLPPLMTLGFIFCLLYEQTGSLYPPIALHAFNNAVAFAVQQDGGWALSLAVGPLMLAACAGLPRVLHGRAPHPLPAHG